MKKTAINGKSKDERQIRRGLRRLARKIAKQLFTRGDGWQADRLRMLSKVGGDAGAGWSQRPVADLIERELLKAGGLR